MKPRIEKKVSKKLAAIVGDAFGKVWVDDELELCRRHYCFQNDGVLSPKQLRENYQQRVSVNHMPSIGGGVDYWGEGEDWCSVYEQVCEALMWGDAVFDDEGNVSWPGKKKRINARWCLRKARGYMESRAA